ISFNIPRDHQESINCGWINWIFWEILWNGKAYNFKNHIEDLITLKYYQVVTGYFDQYPEDLENYSMDILSKIHPNNLLNLIEKYFPFFNIKNPEKLFEKIIESSNIESSYSKLVIKFPKYKRKFTEIIKSYIDKFDLSESYEENLDILRISLVLLSDSWRSLPKPEFEPSYIQEKLTQYLSNPKNAEFFNTSSSTSLSKNFHLFTPEFQKNIITLSSKMHRFSFFLILARYNPNSFLELFDDIIKMNPKDEVDLRTYIYILKFYIVNNKKQNLINKVINKLQTLELSYEKAQLFSYLGKKSQTLEILSHLMEKEEYFLELLFIYVDYISEYIEVNLDGLNRLDIEELIDNIILLKNEYNKYNLRQDRSKKFNFKTKFLLARLKFLYGQSFFSESDFDQAYEQFEESEEIFNKLMDVKPLPKEEKQELEIYYQVVRNFKLFLNQIISDTDYNIDIINQNLKKKILMIEEKYKIDNLKTVRLFQNLKEIQIDSEKNMKFVKFERPATFCPFPIKFQNISLDIIYDEINEKSKLIYQWNSNNKPISPFRELYIDDIWKTYYLILKQQNKFNYFDFNISFKKGNYIKIENEEFIKRNEKELIYKFDLKAEEFMGIKRIKIEIRESDLCEVPNILILPVIYKSKEFQEPYVDKLREIIDNINTGRPDSTKRIQDILSEEIYSIMSFEEGVFANFCNLIQYFIKLMRRDAHNPKVFQESADKWWKEHKDDKRVAMEPDWFHPEIKEHLDKDNWKNVYKEPEHARGNIDFLIYDIPIECKVLTDKRKYSKERSAFEIAKKKFKLQIFQETIDVRCGILLIYDYRKDTIKKELKIRSLSEGIDKLREGENLVIVVTFLGNRSPPSRILS
ncbi:MAG: hypothetical protein ACFFDN_46400, partial [Candidatus Hodarchaeota archaeon]